VLNRVTGDINASQIDRMLTADSRVSVINPSGILIQNAVDIKPASFVAPPQDIPNAGKSVRLLS
jgi:filamentous hemagglutinin family protein